MKSVVSSFDPALAQFKSSLKQVELMGLPIKERCDVIFLNNVIEWVQEMLEELAPFDNNLDTQNIIRIRTEVLKCLLWGIGKFQNEINITFINTKELDHLLEILGYKGGMAKLQEQGYEWLKGEFAKLKNSIQEQSETVEKSRRRMIKIRSCARSLTRLYSKVEDRKTNRTWQKGLSRKDKEELGAANKRISEELASILPFIDVARASGLCNKFTLEDVDDRLNNFRRRIEGFYPEHAAELSRLDKLGQLKYIKNVVSTAEEKIDDMDDDFEELLKKKQERSIVCALREFIRKERDKIQQQNSNRRIYRRPPPGGFGL